MASAADITEVRTNTNEPTQDPFTDAYIGGLIDAGSVASASAAIWRQKAGAYAEIADVSEAGASLKVGELFKNAQVMAKFYEDVDAGISTGLGRGKTHRIVRTT